MPHKIPKLLEDISLACSGITEFINGKTFEQFQENHMLQLAVEREFEIIGEALSRLARIDEHNLARHIPEYRKIIDFRNIVAHGYDVIDEAAMWDFARNRVPELMVKIKNY